MKPHEIYQVCGARTPVVMLSQIHLGPRPKCQIVGGEPSRFLSQTTVLVTATRMADGWRVLDGQEKITAARRSGFRWVIVQVGVLVPAGVGTVSLLNMPKILSAQHETMVAVALAKVLVEQALCENVRGRG